MVSLRGTLVPTLRGILGGVFPRLDSGVFNPLTDYDWYVDPVDGDNANDGLTAATAKKTDAGVTAEGAYVAGDTVGYVLQSGMVITAGPLEPTHVFTAATAPTLNANSRVVNPDTGDDGNDGLTYATAWATMGKAHTACSVAINGITLLVIDLRDRAGPWYVDSNFIPTELADGFRMTGIGQSYTNKNGDSSNFARIVGAQALVNASAVQDGTFTNVYKWSAVADDDTQIWEDDKWLEHVPGANWAAVDSTVNSTPGSFFMDNATGILYVHPIGSTDPTADGKLYLSSRNWDGTYSNLMTLQGTSITADHLRLTHSAITKMADGSTEGAYCLDIANPAGTWDVNNIEAYYGAYHVFGIVSGAPPDNGTVAVKNCLFEQGHPSGNTVMVSSSGSGTGITHTFENITCEACIGVWRSSDGATNSDGSSFYLIHGAFTMEQLTFTNCYAPLASIKHGVDTGLTNPISIDSCRISLCAGDKIEPRNTTFDNGPVTCNATDDTIDCFECRFIPATESQGALRGTTKYRDCLIDLSLASVSGVRKYWMQRSGTTVLTITGTTVVGHASSNYALTLDLDVGSDTLTISGNSYSVEEGYLLHLDLIDANALNNPRDLSWMQFLGYDSGSSRLESGDAVPADVCLWDTDSGVVDDGSGNCTKWTDSVGPYDISAPATTSRKPDIISAAVNGHDALEFIPADLKVMTTAVTIFSDTDLVYMVCVARVDADGDLWTFGTPTSTAGKGGVYFDGVTGIRKSRYNPSTSSTTAVGAAGLPSGFSIIEYQVCKFSIRMWINGEPVAAQELNAYTKAGTAHPIHLGNASYEGSYLDGMVARLQGKQGVVEESHRDTLRSALATKYGITLAA